jgi:hypothetical protein
LSSLYALALISAGQLASAVSLPDDTGAQHALPASGQPLLVVYEDQDGGKQNHAMKDLIAAYHDPIANRARVAVWPVADLSKWNWWPAKSHALSDVQKSASKQNTHILIDWTGALHKAWGLSRGKNSIVLIGSDGKVRYASEGETTSAQRAALEAELQALGLARP